MNEAIGAYRQVSATDEFKEIERLKKETTSNTIASYEVTAEITKNENRINELIFNAFNLSEVEQQLILYFNGNKTPRQKYILF